MPKIYEIIEIKGLRCVVCEAQDRTNSIWPKADFMKTGKALCGVLRPYETFDHWLKEKRSRNFGKVKDKY